jgi:phage gp46-like protein
MDFAINFDDRTGMAGMTFDKATDGNILNNIYFSLMIRKGAFFQNTDFGSRLHRLQRAKNTEKTASLAVEYCREALAWLIDAGRVRKFDFYTERDKVQDLHRLKILIEATKADGDVVSFTTFVEVV